MQVTTRVRAIAGAGAMLAAFAVGCRSDDGPAGGDEAESVVIYCSVDVSFAEPILDRFERERGITVYPVFDTEAGKTTGLVNKLLAERERPRADVWWSSEIFGTMQLAAAGVLAPYRPPSAADVPERYRDPKDRWTAFGLRGRVIAYDPARVKDGDLPRRWADLTDPRYKGRFRMADPRFGTTRGHMAVLLSRWGRGAMEAFYRGLRDNDVVLTDGNAKSVLDLTRGLADFVATDTDDVIVAQARGDQVEMIYPDLSAPGAESSTAGALWIPNSVALVRGGPDPDAGRTLIDFIASAELEERLYASDSHNVPVRPALREKLKADARSEAVVDYAAAAEALGLSDRMVADILLR